VLVTHGPFAVTRNPIYLANLMIVASTFVAAGRWVGAVLAMLLFASAYWLIVRYEEANLRKIFGERYAEYCRSTPRWLPRRLPRGHPFPWRQGLWRERFSLVTYATFVAVYVVTDGLR
jgi:protein-S-isoprenylcysteine O-methyltransferase Ste14